MNLTITDAPTEEPVTLDEVKDWARVTDSAEDAKLEALVIEARQQVERFCQRALLEQTVVQRWDCWPRCIEMLRTPVQSVTSLQYIDTSGVTQTVGSSNYYTDLISEPARLVAAPSYSWPSLQDGRPNAVILTYVAGAADAADVPEVFKTAIKMLVTHRFDHGDQSQAMPDSVRDLLWPYRLS